MSIASHSALATPPANGKMAALGLRPFVVPGTRPDRYISFGYALNLREDGEDTGDWHFLATWFTNDLNDRRSGPVLAGVGCDVDTTLMLDTKGVRDMSPVLLKSEIIDLPRPVWVADHFRAIADIVYADSLRGSRRRHATARQINQWLHTEDEINRLKADFLEPLTQGVPLSGRYAHEQFVGGLVWD